MTVLTKEMLGEAINRIIIQKPHKAFFVMGKFEKEIYITLYGKEPVEGEMYCGMEIVFSVPVEG